MFDSNGNEFDDASSLLIDWRADRSDIGSFVNKGTQYEQDGGDFRSNRNGKTKSMITKCSDNFIISKAFVASLFK